jgi:hypothetical protein
VCKSSSTVREDLVSTAVEFIFVLLAWCESLLQLTFEQAAQQPEEPLSSSLGQIRPLADGLPGIGRGGTVLGERLDMGHRLPQAVKLGPAAGAQPR